MTIVGMTGSIGSGKTTFADFLSEQVDRSGHWESWQLVAEVAEDLRQQSLAHPAPSDVEAINQWLACLPAILEKRCHAKADFRQIRLSQRGLQNTPENFDKLLQYLALMQEQPELQHVPVTEAHKEVLRPILQWLGGYLAKTVGGEVWYREIIRRIQATPDLELATIGGVRFPADAREIKAAGGSIIRIDRPDIAVRDLQDLTERERELIRADASIRNNGTLTQLQECARVVADDLRRGELKREYTAKT